MWWLVSILLDTFVTQTNKNQICINIFFYLDCRSSFRFVQSTFLFISLDRNTDAAQLSILTTTISSAINILSTSIGSLVWMFSIDAVVSTVVIGAVPILFLLSLFFGRIIRQRSRILQDVIRLLVSYLLNVPSVILFVYVHVCIRFDAFPRLSVLFCWWVGWFPETFFFSSLECYIFTRMVLNSLFFWKSEFLFFVIMICMAIFFVSVGGESEYDCD